MIRAASPADAEAFVTVYVRAWRWAYADIVPEAAMPEVDAARTQAWVRILTDGPSQREAMFAFELDGLVAGFVSVGPGRDPDVREDGGELRAVYVDPAAQGAGAGRSLMDAGEARLREDGYSYAVLWVFAANSMAREFYARRGWIREPDDVIAANHAADGRAPAVRYRLAL